jgi:hypothetical protein
MTGDARKMTKRRGIGCGVFLIILGLGLFADRMHWFPFDTVWLLPAAFVAWGIGQIYTALRE